MKNRQTRYQSVTGIAIAFAILCTVSIVAIACILLLLTRAPEPESEDGSMNIDFSLCPLCNQPTGFILKPPTIRDDY